MPITIYHNPRCAKSRAALKLLRDRGLQPEVIEYLKTPPTRAELVALLRLLKLKPRQLLRTKEPEYKKAKLDDPQVADSAILAALVKYPKLMERPIVVVDNRKAALGRPPENVLKILK
jgi:arsenate reductase